MTNNIAVQMLFTPLWNWKFTTENICPESCHRKITKLPQHTQSWQKGRRTNRLSTSNHASLLPSTLKQAITNHQVLVNTAPILRVSTLFPFYIHLSTLQDSSIMSCIKLSQNYHCSCRACNTHEVIDLFCFLNIEWQDYNVCINVTMFIIKMGKVIPYVINV